MKLGTHFIIDMYSCNEQDLNNIQFIRDVFLKLIHVLDVTYITDYFHQFSPYGISGVVIIAESHFTIHTYPEYGYCAIDIFTCGDKPCDNALPYLCEKFNTTNIIVHKINRGEYVPITTLF